MRFRTDCPAGASQGSAAIEPVAADFRTIVLRPVGPDDGDVEITLLRSRQWLADAGAAPGAIIHLDLPELNIVGDMRVVTVGPAPKIETGPGALVTGTFRHIAREMASVRLEGLAEPIRCTPRHPFWSVTRSAFVEARDLRSGEQLLSSSGQPVAIVEMVLAPADEPVYNIEVHGEHVYRVSALGVLVHNASWAVEEAIERGELSAQRILVKPGIHHIASVTDKVFAPQFKELFDKAGLSIQSAWNKTRVAGHVGPHGVSYNQLVLDQLKAAVQGKTGKAYRESLLDSLWDLRRKIHNEGWDNLLRASASKADVMLGR